MRYPLLIASVLCVLFGTSGHTAMPKPPAIVSENGTQLTGTTLLTNTAPLRDRMLDGASVFLDRKLMENRSNRTARWNGMFSANAKDPAEQLEANIDSLRDRLRYISGCLDRRTPTRLSIGLSSHPLPQLSKNVTVQEIQWTVFDDYVAYGFCFTNQALQAQPAPPPLLNLIWIPDSPMVEPQMEPVSGFSLSPATTQQAVRLAESGVRVFVIYPISNCVARRGERIDLTDREYVYRTLFVLGRHPIGIEVQSALALVDWLSTYDRTAQHHDPQTTTQAVTTELESNGPAVPIAIAGEGDSGLSALVSAALDMRLSACVVRGDFGDRDNQWAKPISQNIFSLLTDFGDAQLACMIRPRTLIVDASAVDSYSIKSPGAAPGIRSSPEAAKVVEEIQLVRTMTGDEAAWVQLARDRQEAFEILLRQSDLKVAGSEHETKALPFPPHFRQHQLRQIESLSDRWIQSSRSVRDAWANGLDTSSPENYAKSIATSREKFEHDVIGRFNDALLPANPSSRLWKETENWTGWEVEVDVFPELTAGGILLVPNGIEASAPRPVVVCVHGLEGTPLDTIEGDHRAYHDFAAKLCEQGYIVFCPQQLYLGGDRFRVLQRKANPLGKTLFSLMIPQHRQLLAFLKTLPYVDSQKIAFYGLSYGGKSAMRIPAAIEDYCASICSADFNEWVLKNASTRDSFSYVWTPEYEIFEFDLAGTFNYAEMAALICPRPFMVERGHFDGVAVDPWVAFEYAKVRHLYAARLGIPDKTEIEWFVGPHTIHGQGTFKFLRQHLTTQ